MLQMVKFNENIPFMFNRWLNTCIVDVNRFTVLVEKINNKDLGSMIDNALKKDWINGLNLAGLYIANFPENFPLAYKEAKAIASIDPSYYGKELNRVLTTEGVLALCKWLEMDPETLVMKKKNKETSLTQNSLFETTSEFERLFKKEEKEKESSNKKRRRRNTLTHNNFPALTFYPKRNETKRKSYFYFSKPLCRELERNLEIVRESKASHRLFANFFWNEEEKVLAFQFVSEGLGDLVLNVEISEGHIDNIYAPKHPSTKGYTNVVISKFLRETKLYSHKSINVEIDTKNNALLFKNFNPCK